MKGKKIKGFSPMEGALNFIGSLNKFSNSRKNALTFKKSDVVIDTVCPPDTGIWETGIRIGNDKWIIVSQYDDYDDAKIGHKNYVKEVESGKKDFKDIDLWNLDK